MSLERVGADWAYGPEDVDAPAGITEVTGAEASQEFGTQVEGKGADGEVKAFLYGTKKNSMAVEGYASSLEVPEIGGDITVAGLDGIVMRSSITASFEDFAKARTEGVGYPDLP